MFKTFLTFFALWCVAASSAFAADPYTIAGVPVEARGSSAIAAQTDAILKGQTRAAELLVERLTLASERQGGTYVPPTSEEATKMIRAMSVANEKRSSDRYIGDITVAFVPRRIRAFIEARDLTLLDTQARTRTVLPVANGVLVESTHPWAEAWANPAVGFSLTPVELPDLDSLLAMGVDMGALRRGDEETLAMVSSAIGAQQLMIAEASGSTGYVSVNMTDVAADSKTVQPAGTASGRSYMGAALAAVSTLQDSWKSANASVVTADSGALTSTEVTVVFSSLNEWQRLQSAIAGSARVRDSRLDALAKSGALMNLTYVGDISQLAGELSGKGSSLTQHPSLGMIISRPGYTLP